MRHRLVPFFGILFVALVVPGLAQDKNTLSSAAGDAYVISAKAGGINHIEGTAVTIRSDGTSGRVVKGDTLEAGDVLETTGAGRVELLLNPGSYARLDHSSRLELVTTSLDDLKLRMLKGSAIFEVYANDDFKVTVQTPKGEIYLIKTGVYRVDVLDSGSARLEVRQGKALTSDDSNASLKKGRYATIDGGDLEIAKFDRGDRDGFEQWSRNRAELIAKANKKLQTKALSNSLLRGFRSDMWDCYGSVGLWVFSPRYGTYSFLPFGYGWRSPYGFGLRTSTTICYDPSYFYYRPYRGAVGGGSGSGTAGGGNTPSGQRTSRFPNSNSDRASRNRTPPFQRVQRTGGVRTASRTRMPMAGSSFPTFEPSVGGGSATTTTSTRPAKSKSKGRGN